ncbi:MAG: hypothetical protein ACRD22_12705, partial [Terriglobia bacterium]
MASPHSIRSTNVQSHGRDFTDNTVFFSSFAEGEYGDQGAWLVGWSLTRTRLYYRGAWHGRNIMRYYDGSLGPRAATLDVTPINILPGTVRGMGATGIPGDSFWVIVDTAVSSFDAEDPTGGTVHDYSPALAKTPVAPVSWVRIPGQTLITSLGDQAYLLDHAAHQVFTITDRGAAANSPGGTCCASYGGLFWIGAGVGAAPGSVANRLYYSHVLNLALWDTSQDYVDVGAPNESGIIGLFNLRTSLMIEKEDGTWWRLSGVPVPSESSSAGSPGTTGNMTITQVTQASGSQLGSTRGAVVGETIFFVPEYYDIIGMHNGSKVENLRYLRFNDGNWMSATGSNIFPPYFNVTPLGTTLRGRKDVLFLGTSGRTAVNRDNVWTFHQFPDLLDTGGWATYVGSHVVLSDGGAYGQSAKF